MKKNSVIVLLAMVMSIMLSVPVNAASTTVSGQWSSVFVVMDQIPAFYTIVHKAEMTLHYSDYATPLPGYRVITENDLAGCILNAYSPYPHPTYPFGIAVGPLNIKRYDNNRLGLTISNLQPYDFLADLDDLWSVGKSSTTSYLFNGIACTYRFDGRITVIADAAPWVQERVVSKTFIIY